MKRIMILDDESGILELYKAGLETEGYKVTTQTNPYKALADLEDAAYDLVITDVQMPNLDGITFTNWARMLRPDLKYMVISGYTEYETNPALTDARCFFHKTDSIMSLVEKVNALIKN